MKLFILQAGAEGSGGLGYQQLFMFALMGLVLYFFMIRPQMKKTKEAKLFRESLAVGDKVITAGGIHGKILEIGETNILLSVESGKIRVEKNSVTNNDMEQLANQKK